MDFRVVNIHYNELTDPLSSRIKEGESPITPVLVDDCLAALLLESRKEELVYKRHAIKALGDALAATGVDRFQQLYDIVKGVLAKVCLLIIVVSNLY